MTRSKIRKLMRIGQAAKAAGVSTQTVEYYIMLGLIDPLTLPDRRSRFFNASLVKRIRLIRELNEKNKNDRQAKSQATMELYRHAGPLPGHSIFLR